MNKHRIEQIRNKWIKVINTPEWKNIYCKDRPNDLAKQIYKYVLKTRGY